MKHAQTVFSLLAGLFWLCSVAQPAPTEHRVLDIRATVKDIDSHLKDLNKSRVNLQTGTDRGGELTVYRRGSDIVRMDATVSGSSSDVQDIFYFSGNKFVFVKTKTLTYPYSSKLNGFDFAAPHLKFAADYYVRDGKLIPLAQVTIPPAAESRLFREAELFVTAIRRGDQVIDVERLIK